MCKAVEDYANELFEERAKVLVEEYVNKQAAECVKRMLADGIPLETALRYASTDFQGLKNKLCKWEYPQ